MADQDTKDPSQDPAQSQTQEQPEAPPAESKVPDPQVAVEDSGTLKKKVTVTVARERINAKFNEMFGELTQTAQVPGFRIGHAPRRLIEKRFGREIAEDVRNALVGESLGRAMEIAELKVLGEPELKLEEIKLPDDGDLNYSFEVEVAPAFDLPEYRGIEITRPIVEVNDQRVREALNAFSRRYGVMKPTDTAIQPNDELTADVKIAGEGVAYHHANVELRAAPAQVEGVILEELARSLAKHKVGEKVTLTAKVPAAHPNADWQNKDVTVALEIKEVKRLDVPPVDDNLARQGGYESLEALREMVRSNLQRRVASEQQIAMRDQVGQYLLEHATFDLPAGLAERHTDRILSRRYVDLMYRGVPREEIEQNLEPMRLSAAEQAVGELKLAFMLGKIADQEKVEVDEGEVNTRIAEMARQYNRRPERLRQEMDHEGRLDDLKAHLREEKAVDKILESAKVVDATPEAIAEKAAEKAAKKKPAKGPPAQEKPVKKAEEKPHKKVEEKAQKTPEKHEKADQKHGKHEKPQEKPKVAKGKPHKADEKKDTAKGKGKPKGKSSDKK